MGKKNGKLKRKKILEIYDMLQIFKFREYDCMCSVKALILWRLIYMINVEFFLV